ncbi:MULTISPECIES: hypothetical protein [unclassified Mycobacterium]|uniref:hypothetical protein n=1 Tax=unclassified Mycobacterium TaxID=2642494 RepID=UPI00148243A3|nr:MULTISPECIES: hypothetical protein [unclassified Mycobacterium]
MAPLTIKSAAATQHPAAASGLPSLRNIPLGASSSAESVRQIGALEEVFSPGDAD